MCILNDPVIEVSNTSIFCAKDSEGKRQLTIYENLVSTPTGNAMILPFPTVDGFEGEQLEFHDISKIDGLFSNLHSAFYDPSLRNARSKHLEDECDGMDTDGKCLEVHDVGSYLASKCYSIKDLKRIDSSVFRLSSGVEALLRKEYPTGFGFVVCKLKENPKGEKYEPFAYSHRIPEGKGNELFIPTKHYHQHSGNVFSKIYESIFPASVKGDWDHNIFIYDYESGLSGSFNNDKWCWNMSLPRAISQLEAIVGFPFKSATSFKKLELAGQLPNEDLWVHAH
jgi:hypothetical protein